MSEIELFHGNPERLALLARTIASGASPDELALFAMICDRTGLCPFARQIFFIERWDNKAQKKVRQPQTSIDGFRLVAQRSREYEGQTPPLWFDESGKAVDLWTSDRFPFAARVGVWRKGFREPCVATALWSEYCQRTKDGSPTGMWSKMPALMLAKCAEALALRKAFPAELSGLYTSEEMAQASVIDGEAVEIAPKASRAKPEPKALPMIEGRSEPSRAVSRDAENLALLDAKPAQQEQDCESVLIGPDALGEQVGRYWKVAIGDGRIVAAEERFAGALEANAAFGVWVVGRVKKFPNGKSALVDILRNATDEEVRRGTV